MARQSSPPEYRHRDLLDKHRAHLGSAIRVSDHLLNLMTEQGIITDGPRQSIQSCVLPFKRAGELLDYLKQRPETDFKVFIQCMQEDNQGHVFTTVPSYGILTGPSGSGLRVETLAAALKQCYKRRFNKVQFLPWDEKDCLLLSDVYVSLECERTCGHTKLQHYADMLSLTPDIQMPSQNPKETKPHQIFVLGEPGVGKSTFSKKISLDWAEGNVDALKQFKVLVTIFLRSHRLGESVEDTLCRELLPHDDGFVSRQVREIMKSLGPECLLVLDGLDELKGISEDLRNIIENKSLCEATVIITSRPMPNETTKHADVRVKILGFEGSAMNEYIVKFFNSVKDQITPEQDLAESCMGEINQRGFHDMNRVPFLLHLLCIQYYNMKQLPETITAVYKNITTYITRRYKSVKSESGEEVEEAGLQSALNKLRKLAYDSLISGILIFDEEELNITLSSDMLEIGFLSCWDIPRKLEKSKQLTFLHKSFQEYFAAEYIVNNYASMDGLWEYCNNEERVFALKQMFAICCGLKADVGVKILKKIEEMNVIRYQCDLFGYKVNELCRLQMECLCEVASSIDISDLYCFVHVYIVENHVPSHVTFKPALIELRSAYLHGFEENSFTVSSRIGLKNREQSGKKVNLCSDQLQALKLWHCELKSADVCALFKWMSRVHQLTELNLSTTRLSGTLPAALSACDHEFSFSRLDMRECGLTGEDMRALAQWLVWAPHLDELFLWGNTASFQELQPLQRVLATRQRKMRVSVDVAYAKLWIWRQILPQHDIVGHKP